MAEEAGVRIGAVDYLASQPWPFPASLMIGAQTEATSDGPDAPIAAGIVDDLNAAGFKAFGPTRAAGQLESSKSFTKALCRANNIPTAAWEHFADAEKAKAYIRKQGAPIVVKADGLAAGKGVVVAMTEAEALAAVDMMFGGGFGEAGAEVVVEEFMVCLLYTSPSPRDRTRSRMPSSA